MPLLDRFQEVISKYNKDEDSSEPLARYGYSILDYLLPTTKPTIGLILLTIIEGASTRPR